MSRSRPESFSEINILGNPLGIETTQGAPMRYARILSIGLVATVAFAWSAAAVENAHKLAGYCQSLEHGAKGDGRHLYIPRTREALTCWGYMQARTSRCSPMRRGTGLSALVRRSRR